MADQDPKITLLQRKLALLIGPEDCPVYDTIKAQHPHALEEPWSADMSGPEKHVVFNNKTFTMHELSTREEAYKLTFQSHRIDCGENIKLYLDDNLFRDLQQAMTMDWDLLKRTEMMETRAVKSKWYYCLTGWVDKIKGGPGEMGPSPSGKTCVMKVKGNGKKSGRKLASSAH